MGTAGKGTPRASSAASPPATAIANAATHSGGAPSAANGCRKDDDCRNAVGRGPPRDARRSNRFQRHRCDGDAELAPIAWSRLERRSCIDTDRETAGTSTPRRRCGQGDVTFNRLLGHTDPVHANPNPRHWHASRPPDFDVERHSPVDAAIDRRNGELSMWASPRKDVVSTSLHRVEALTKGSIWSERYVERGSETHAEEDKEGDDS
jgi:hypothetical protein